MRERLKPNTKTARSMREEKRLARSMREEPRGENFTGDFVGR
jgi:hypothetical protein